MTRHIIAGLDPGVRTGVALWSLTEQRLTDVSTMTITEAMTILRLMQEVGSLHSVVMEDARLRTWFGAADARAARSGAGIREGVGSVKRDCQILAGFCGELGIAYKSVKPAAGATKWDAEKFRRLTGWTGRTSNHARDAALLVFGMKAAT